mmetsp:Transcript_35384/g.72249  ORF Transcript_35384/g.72249 Transcript_35384/m.72249 type:complete len:234 (-) Transcript_35384:69-770(-)
MRGQVPGQLQSRRVIGAQTAAAGPLRAHTGDFEDRAVESGLVVIEHHHRGVVSRKGCLGDGHAVGRVHRVVDARGIRPCLGLELVPKGNLLDERAELGAWPRAELRLAERLGVVRRVDADVGRWKVHPGAFHVLILQEHELGSSVVDVLRVQALGVADADSHEHHASNLIVRRVLVHPCDSVLHLIFRVLKAARAAGGDRQLLVLFAHRIRHIHERGECNRWHGSSQCHAHEE